MIATVFAAPGAVTAWAAIGVVVLFGGLWVASVVLRDVSIVDPAWGPAFALVAVIAAITGSGDGGVRWLLAAMTVIWGLRLGGYLLVRKRAEPEEDRRYQAIRERKGDAFIAYSLVAIFGSQGLLVLIISLPQQVAAGRPGSLSAWVVAGIVVWAIGVFFEAVGDEQMRRFKADPAGHGQVMDRGLWRYTRHPNYFGDFCVWWGLWLVAVTAGGTWWTVIGPLIMSGLLIQGTGKKMLERDIAQRRPAYADYVERTSGFVPLPPRRRGSSR